MATKDRGEKQKLRLLGKAARAAEDLESLVNGLTWEDGQRSNEFIIAADRILKAVRLLQSAVEMGLTGRELAND